MLCFTGQDGRRIIEPGDLILTGTPDGVVDCQPGDVIVTSIEGIGDLVNTIQQHLPASS